MTTKADRVDAPNPAVERRRSFTPPARPKIANPRQPHKRRLSRKAPPIRQSNRSSCSGVHIHRFRRCIQVLFICRAARGDGMLPAELLVFLLQGLVVCGQLGELQFEALYVGDLALAECALGGAVLFSAFEFMSGSRADVIFPWRQLAARVIVMAGGEIILRRGRI